MRPAVGAAVRARVAAALLLVAIAASGALAAPKAQGQTCAASVGPGIAPPSVVARGIPGFHAHWYGQSGYPTLCPGQRSTATVAYLNSGSLGWVRGVMGQVAYLGTWAPDPGQDRPTVLGGDGQHGSPATGWPRYNRIAQQPAHYVGPGQVAWFQFTIEAPATPGHYRLFLRPLIEGAAWLEDFGVHWPVTVLHPDGARPVPAPAVPSPLGYSHLSVPTARGTFGVHLVRQPLAAFAVKTATANAQDCASDCPVKPLDRYISEAGAYAGMNGTYLCPPDYAACAGKVNSYDYAVYNSDLGRWLNAGALVSTNGLATFSGATPRFYRRSESYDRHPVTAGISNFPLLLQDGAVVDSEGEQGASLKLRGTRGALGTDGISVYLAIVTGASVTETAFALQALGARDALNLDGGGTSALFSDGSYRVGPGRALPNAVLLVRR